ADLFAGAKTVIKENTDGSSGLYQAMTVAGLGAAAVGGYMTKNWVGAIGGFSAGMIFTNFAMSMIGL
ncbi:type IV conjugative transfer system pilin TraA, partial [Photobacterium frigidiphilum]